MSIDLVGYRMSVPHGYTGPVRVRTTTRHSNWASLHALSDYDQDFPSQAETMKAIGNVEGAARSFACGVDIFIVPLDVPA